MQYKTGTVTVTNANNSVVGVGTAFLANVPVGSMFTKPGSGVAYQVAAVPDDTHLTLAANYGGATEAAIAYLVTTSFTPNQQLPYPQQGDIDTPSIFARAINKIDAIFGLWSKFGAVAVVNPTAPNRTLKVTVNGVDYYIAAKTTND